MDLSDLSQNHCMKKHKGNSTPVLFTLTGHLLLRHACIFYFLQAEGTLVINYYLYLFMIITQK
jgi:hypothetical protein